MSYKPKIKSTQFWDNLQPLQPWTHNCALFHWQVPSKSILDLAGNSSSNGSSRTTKAREGGSLPFKQQQQTPILWKMSLTQLRATLSGRSLKGVVLPRIRCLTNFITSRNYLSRSSVAKWSALLSVVLKLILVKSLGQLRWPCYKCARTLQELWKKIMFVIQVLIELCSHKQTNKPWHIISHKSSFLSLKIIVAYFSYLTTITS